MPKLNSQIFIILTSTVLMQIHSIQFWIEQIGGMGVAWSLTLEIVMLWFWWRKIPLLALLSSALLITGPLHQITQPSISAIQQQRQDAQSNQADSKEINRLSSSLVIYEKNSQQRLGWLSKINEIQQRINEATRRISERNAKNSEFRFFGISTSEAIAIAQSLTLIIIIIAQAIAISDQRKISEEKKNPNRNKRMHDEKNRKKLEIAAWHKAPGTKISLLDKYSEASEKDRKKASEQAEAISKIPAAIHVATKAIGLSQGEWCRRHKVNPKHLSLAKNHAERRMKGLELAPAEALSRILNSLNISPAEEPNNER